MPPNYSLTSLGSARPFQLAGSCLIAAQWANGGYMPHQGDPDSFLVADARTRDGAAAVRLALWRCVHCGTLLTGIARAEDDPDETREFTWLEESVVLLGTGEPAAGALVSERGSDG